MCQTFFIGIYAKIKPIMLRSFMIYLSKAGWARQAITRWKIGRQAASRFVAGETLEDALRVVETLNAKGMLASLDHLGEHTYTPDEARAATRDILEMIESIDKARVRSNVSIKLTQIGLALDDSLCAENLARILGRARECGAFVRIDMEDSPWVDKTLGLYRKMRFERGLENVGVVIQSYLYRSQEDVTRLAGEGARVRLCKGAYKEPADVAFPKKRDVDANYDRLMDILIDSSRTAGFPAGSQDGKIPPIPAVASHDPERIAHAKAYAQNAGVPKNALEFQMLYGIRRDLQEHLAAEGYPMRVYVPFGTQWYPYFMRRLAERPANIWFFISNLIRK